MPGRAIYPKARKEGDSTGNTVTLKKKAGDFTNNQTVTPKPCYRSENAKDDAINIDVTVLPLLSPQGSEEGHMLGESGGWI